MNGNTSNDGAVTFVVSLRVVPGREAAFLALLEPVLDAMRHEATFINAVLHRDPEDPAHFMIYETWADFGDVANVQIHRDYRKAYLSALDDLLREPRQIGVWHPVRADFAPPVAKARTGHG
jgi:quinol monooxygenase YgiN